MDPKQAMQVDSLTVYVRGRAIGASMIKAGPTVKLSRGLAEIRQASLIITNSYHTLKEDSSYLWAVSSIVSNNVSLVVNDLAANFDLELIESMKQEMIEIHRNYLSVQVLLRNRRESKQLAWDTYLSLVDKWKDRVLAYWGCVYLAKLICPPVTKDIAREIYFSPENQQASIGILSYFAVVLQQKMPGSNAAVSIRQESNKVTLKISYPDGREEEISQLLADYGLVVAGKKPPETLLSNPLEVMALNHKLEMAAMELRNTKEMHALEKGLLVNKIGTLDEDIVFLKSQLAIQLQGNERLTQALLNGLNVSSSSAINSDMMELLRSLLESISLRDQVTLAQDAKGLAEKDPALFQKFSSFIVSSGASGVIGNAAYAWLLPLWPAIISALSNVAS